MKKSEYIFNNNAFINEGFSTGTITKAAMYFTKEYIYIIPDLSQQILGNKEYTTTEYTNSESFLLDLESKIDTISSNDFHKMMQSFLPENLVNGIVSLDKFTISTGWLTAGIKLKAKGGKLKTISLKPRAQLSELKAFYNL